MTPSWLRCSDQPFDRGAKAPRFPYSRYSPIETEDDCFRVIQDEAQQWNEPFRAALVSRACKLIALLNKSHRFHTTHTVIGSEDPKKIKGYEWAVTSLGIAITIMFRDPPIRFVINEHVRLVHGLCQTWSSPDFSDDPTGWLVGVWPEVILYENPCGWDDIPGYGVEIRVTAFGQSESCCSRRLSGLLDSLTDVLSRTVQRSL
jgi:hypothetical protein